MNTRFPHYAFHLRAPSHGAGKHPGHRRQHGPPGEYYLNALIWILSIIALTLAFLAMSQTRTFGASYTQHGNSSAAPDQVLAYRVVTIAGDTVLQPVTLIVPDGQNRLVYALDAMAAFQNSPLPAGTQIRSFTLADNGMATLDMNSAFVTNFAGGEDAEALAINAIVRVLQQDAAIKNVTITVENAVVDTLGGHTDLSKPIPVTLDRPKRYLHRRVPQRVPHTVANRKPGTCPSR